MTSTLNKWSRQDIRNARRASLTSLLHREAVQMRELDGGNFELIDHPGLIVKNSYWRWPDQNRQGNTIDFFVHIRGMSFSQAMDIICR